MSVIQRIRDKGAWIVFSIIALALIAFILQDSSLRRGNMFSNTTTVGKVNGVKIEKNEFDSKVDFFQQMQGAQAGTRDQMMGNVWNYMVDNVVMQQEFVKLGLGFTSKELTDALFGDNPPPFLKQQFTDPKTGIYKVDEAKAYFAQVKKQKNNPQVGLFQEAYVQPVIDQALRQKYQALISNAVYVPKWMAEKLNADNNSIANISYAFVPYSTISDSAVQVADADIDAYVAKHPKQFQQEQETRSVSYISFDVFPSAEDSTAVLNQLISLKPGFIATNDAQAYVGSKGSAISFLDGYTTKNNLKVPKADSIMSLADGQVFGPYLDNQNYVLAKMVGRRMIPDSVKLRHILIKTADKDQQTLPDSIAKKRIDSIATAIQGGADFNAMVLQYSDDDGSKATKGEYDFSSTQFGNISREFAETIFYGKTGDKKTVHVSNAQYSGYHYIEVLNQKNFEDAFKIAYLAKPLSASAETINTASTAATQFAASSRDKKTFDENAKKLNKIPLSSPEIKENDVTVGALGESRAFVRWVYEGKPGDVSEPLTIGDHNVVAVITGINKAGLQNAQTARPMVENIVKNEKKAKQIIDTKIKGSTLEAIAQAAGTTVQKADSISFQAQTITGIGFEPKVVGAAFNKEVQGKVSSPIAGNTGVLAIKGEVVSAKASLNGNVDSQRMQLQQQIMQQIGYRSIGALTKAAEVKDYRSKFY